MNPYVTPKTPSHEISHKSPKRAKEKTLKAFRKGTVFYCLPSFESPRVCFSSGKEVDDHCMMEEHQAYSQTMGLFIHPYYKAQKLRFQLMKYTVTIIIMVISIVLFKSFYLSILSLFVVLGFFLIFNSKGAVPVIMNVNPDDNGYIEIRGGHVRLSQLR